MYSQCFTLHTTSPGLITRNTRHAFHITWIGRIQKFVDFKSNFINQISFKQLLNQLTLNADLVFGLFFQTDGVILRSASLSTFSTIRFKNGAIPLKLLTINYLVTFSNPGGSCRVPNRKKEEGRGGVFNLASP